MADNVRETLSTAVMAKGLGVSAKLLLRLRRQAVSPFRLGVHYRFQGITTAAPVRWFPKETDEAFSSFQRLDPTAIETMAGGNE